MRRRIDAAPQHHDGPDAPRGQGACAGEGPARDSCTLRVSGLGSRSGAGAGNGRRRRAGSLRGARRGTRKKRKRNAAKGVGRDAARTRETAVRAYAHRPDRRGPDAGRAPASKRPANAAMRSRRRAGKRGGARSQSGRVRGARGRGERDRDPGLARRARPVASVRGSPARGGTHRLRRGRGEDAGARTGATAVFSGAGGGVCRALGARALAAFGARADARRRGRPRPRAAPRARSVRAPTHPRAGAAGRTSTVPHAMPRHLAAPRRGRRAGPRPDRAGRGRASGSCGGTARPVPESARIARRALPGRKGVFGVAERIEPAAQSRAGSPRASAIHRSFGLGGGCGSRAGIRGGVAGPRTRRGSAFDPQSQRMRGKRRTLPPASSASLSRTLAARPR